MALAWRQLGEQSSGSWVRAIAGASTAVAALAVASAGYQVAHPIEFAERHIARLLARPHANAEELNDTAWMIAIDQRSSPELLEGALRLAERAAEDTGHEQAHILDTLAEVHFQLGHRDEAVAAIDEAILRDPDEDYYREQRRRFLGERAPDDRPFFPPQPAPTPNARKEEGLSV